MFLNLVIGLPVVVVCLGLQALLVTVCLRNYARMQHRERRTRWFDFNLLTMVMLLMLAGNFIQMVIWATVFLSLGEFNQFATALYFSAVNFTTLGYGDIVMSPAWRLLGPMEAGTGILMFGISTAVMTAAVMDIIKDRKHLYGEDD